MIIEMFGILEKLTKATIAVALSPVALAVDIVTLPLSAENGDDAFGRTGKLLDSAGDNIKKAVSSDD
jgi:hypothetical protein